MSCKRIEVLRLPKAVNNESDTAVFVTIDVCMFKLKMKM